MRIILGGKEQTGKYHNGTQEILFVYHAMKLVWSSVSSWWRDAAKWRDKNKWRE